MPELPSTPNGMSARMKTTLNKNRSFHLSARMSISRTEKIKYRKIPQKSAMIWTYAARIEPVYDVALAIKTMPYSVDMMQVTSKNVSDFRR